MDCYDQKSLKFSGDRRSSISTTDSGLESCSLSDNSSIYDERDQFEYDLPDSSEFLLKDNIIRNELNGDKNKHLDVDKDKIDFEQLNGEIKFVRDFNKHLTQEKIILKKKEMENNAELVTALMENKNLINKIDDLEWENFEIEQENKDLQKKFEKNEQNITILQERNQKTEN